LPECNQPQRSIESNLNPGSVRGFLHTAISASRLLTHLFIFNTITKNNANFQQGVKLYGKQ